MQPEQSGRVADQTSIRKDAAVVTRQRKVHRRSGGRQRHIHDPHAVVHLK